MTTPRIFLAGVLEAVAMFTWSFVAHMVLPLAETGVGEIPNEDVAMAGLQTSIGAKAGLYLFPGAGLPPNASSDEKSAAMQRMNDMYAKRPSGFLVYHPPGRAFAFGKWLGVEFATELVEALLVVSLLAQTRIVTFAGRVAFVTAAGLLAAITTNISYWNWYGFPTDYTLAYMTTQIVGFFCAGLVAAIVFRGAAASSRA